MLDTTNTINPNFTPGEDAKIVGLAKYEPQQNRVESIRPRKSKLDHYLHVILNKKSQGWSYQRIADYLKEKHGFVKLNKSTVMRRINKFYEAE